MKKTFRKVMSNGLWVMGMFFLFLLITHNSSLITVYAHILKSDGSIGAVLHIDPEDDPIVNQPATFYFEFKDTKGKFNILNCECFVSISSSEKQIYTAQLKPIVNEAGEITGANNSSFGFVFPQKDVYSVVVNGKPLNGDAFSPFTLSFDLRITREGNQQISQNAQTPNWISTHLTQVLAGGAVLIFFVGAFITKKITNK